MKEIVKKFCTYLDTVRGSGLRHWLQDIHHCRTGDFVWYSLKLDTWNPILDRENALNDNVFTFGFMKYGISAVVLIVIFSVVGYGYFRYQKEV